MKVHLKLFAASMLVMCGLIIAPANVHAEPMVTTSPSLVQLRWDDTTTLLNWDGSKRAVATATFSESGIVLVPGDLVEHRATVVNGGPSTANVTVQIADVTTVNPHGVGNPDFEEVIRMFWDIDGYAGDHLWKDLRLAQNGLGVSHSVSFTLDQDEEFSMILGYYFPLFAMGGNPMSGDTS
ncbi:MAG: hypothetical protein FWD55_03080, partial [Propionibacteriaceae bacterium]|nr:hypothetical protein [Propionibacteriaceae bacterium]